MLFGLGRLVRGRERVDSSVLVAFATPLRATLLALLMYVLLGNCNTALGKLLLRTREPRFSGAPLAEHTDGVQQCRVRQGSESQGVQDCVANHIDSVTSAT
jgi:hypothetical protein